MTRGMPLARCDDCGRPIWRVEYATRPGGPLGVKCGGPVRRLRARAVVKAAQPAEAGEDQLELFVVVKEAAG